MRKKLFRSFAIVLVVVLMLSAFAINASAEYVAYVNTDGTVARSGAGPGYPIIAVFNSGTKVTVVEEYINGWFYVTIDGNPAYIPGANISQVPLTTTSTYFAAFINTANVNLRCAPSTAYGSIATLPLGKDLIVVGEMSNGWCGVYVDGLLGYVYGAYVTPGSYYVPTVVNTVSYTAFVNTNGTNIRVAPSSAYASMGTLPFGTEVTVVEEYANGWFGVYLGATPGFIYGSYLTKGNYYDAPVISVTPVSYAGYINTTGAEFRVAPNTAYASMMPLPRGIAVDVIEETSNGWCGVKINGVPGYVYGAYVTPGTYVEEPMGIDVGITHNPVSYSATINTPSVAFRYAPSTAYAVIAYLPAGTPILVVDELSNGWIGAICNGVPGFVYGAYVTP